MSLTGVTAPLAYVAAVVVEAEPPAYGKIACLAIELLVRTNLKPCGIVEMRGVQDQEGTPCARYASTLCYDCGTSLCSDHLERCELCAETFCASCLSFHQNEHPKRTPTDRVNEPLNKKSA